MIPEVSSTVSMIDFSPHVSAIESQLELPVAPGLHDKRSRVESVASVFLSGVRWALVVVTLASWFAVVRELYRFVSIQKRVPESVSFELRISWLKQVRIR